MKIHSRLNPKWLCVFQMMKIWKIDFNERKRKHLPRKILSGRVKFCAVEKINGQRKKQYSPILNLACRYEEKSNNFEPEIHHLLPFLKLTHNVPFLHRKHVQCRKNKWSFDNLLIIYSHLHIFQKVNFFSLLGVLFLLTRRKIFKK